MARADRDALEMHDTVLEQRRLIDRMPSGLIQVDAEGRIELVNARVSEMFGYSEDELLGQPVELLVPKRLRDRHRDERSAYLRAPEERAMGKGRDLYGQRKDGSEFPVEVGLAPVRNGPGAVLCTIVDISDRKRVAQERERLVHELDRTNDELRCLYRVSELTLRDALDSLDPGILEQLPDIVVEGLSDGAVAGVSLIFDGKTYESEHFRETARVLSDDLIVDGHVRGKLSAYFNSNALDFPEGEFIRQKGHLLGAVALEICRMYERFDAAVKVIQASKLASVGEMAAGVSHEINNPINGIINCAQLLLKEAEQGSKNEKYLQLILGEAHRVSTIVRSLLTFSRQQKSEFSPARLSDIVESTLVLSRKRLEKSKIKIAVDVPKNLPRIHCRSEQIQQVLMNLISNALFALDERYPDGDPDKTLTIAAMQRNQNGKKYLRLIVKDHGGGVSPEIRDRIFDPFFTTKGRDVGTGLGLAVSDGIVKLHGGLISVESEEGKWTRFLVDFPLPD